MDYTSALAYEQTRAHLRAARTMFAFGHPVAGVGQLVLAIEYRRLARDRRCIETIIRALALLGRSKQQAKKGKRA